MYVVLGFCVLLNWGVCLLTTFSLYHQDELFLLFPFLFQAHVSPAFIQTMDYVLAYALPFSQTV